MSSLTSGPFADGRASGDGEFMGAEHNGKLASGIIVDGVGYALAGQPPIAQQHSWGDMGWLMWARRKSGAIQVGRSYPSK